MNKDLEQLLGLVQTTSSQFWAKASPILERLLDDRLQENGLAFIVGVSLGWFMRSLVKAKPQPSGQIHGNPGLYRNKGPDNLYLDRNQPSNLDKLAKEDIEYKARKRL